MSPLDSEFMTVGEFAGLPSDVHHAVWQAAAAGKVDSVSGSPSGITRRYRRAQVLALMRGGEPAPPDAPAGNLS